MTCTLVFLFMVTTRRVGLRMLKLCVSPAFGLWGPSYFNRCYHRVDRTLALGLSFPCANRSGLIVYTWALINAKNVESSIRNVSHYRTLIKLLEISKKRILVACQAVSMDMLYLHTKRNERSQMWMCLYSRAAVLKGHTQKRHFHLVTQSSPLLHTQISS